MPSLPVTLILLLAAILVFPPRISTTVLSSGSNIKDDSGIFITYKRFIDKRIWKIDSIMGLEDFSKYGTWTSFDSAKRGLTDIHHGLEQMENSSTVYHLFYLDSLKKGFGVTTVDSTNGEIEIEYGHRSGNDEVIAHEIEHAIQYERGEISLLRDGTVGSLCDITDEKMAYWYAWVVYGYVVPVDSIYHTRLRKFDKAYENLFDNARTIKTKTGRALRARTKNAGKENKVNPEFYKGWEQDYLKGCQELSDKIGPLPENSPCMLISRRSIPRQHP